MNIDSCYREAEKQKEVGSLEAWAYKLIEMLSEQRSATRDNIQRKQARTGMYSYNFLHAL